MKLPLTTCTWAAIWFAIAPMAGAANYEWSFNDGSLDDAFGNGTMTPVGATFPNFVTTNGGAIPHINGVPAQVLHVPAFTSDTDGFNLAFNASGANGGSALYINQYTLIFDLYSPGLPGWQALFQTDPFNSNDADWYIAPDSSLGIAALNYSLPDAVPQNTWVRLAFAADLGAGRATFYVNGNPVAQFIGDSILDGRFALYSNIDAGDDLRLFNEGDTSGVYTHELYVDGIAFVDRELSGLEMSALGGPNSAGILVPEPGTGLLMLAGLAVGAAQRRRR